MDADGFLPMTLIASFHQCRPLPLTFHSSLRYVSLPGAGVEGKERSLLKELGLGQAEEPQKSPHLITCAKVSRLGQPLSLSLVPLPPLSYLPPRTSLSWKTADMILQKSTQWCNPSPLPMLSSCQFMASLIPSVSSSFPFPDYFEENLQ